MVELNFQAGDYVKLQMTNKGLEGTVLENPDSSILLIKLNSGYNIGLRKENILAARALKKFKDEKKGFEVPRGKEEAEDYRFISDPDLQDIIIEKKMVFELQGKMPESPDVKLEKLIKKHKIGKADAEILAKNIDIVSFFEQVASKIDAKFALPWVTVELLRFLNYNKVTLDKIDVRVEHFATLLRLVKEGKITELKGKEILNKFYPRSFMPSAGGEGKISDVSELKKVALKVISENTKAVSDYKVGEKKAFEFLVGKIMEATKKRADFKIAREVLEKELKGMK